MQGVTLQNITPIMKCTVLFLLVFIAKVLTTQPQENLDSKNHIQHGKQSPYVRTFTKYHHRRTQSPEYPWYSNWPVTHEPKTRSRRSIDIPDSNGLVYKEHSESHLSQFASDLAQDNFIETAEKKSSGKDIGGTNKLGSEEKRYKVKAAIIVTDPPKVFTPGISCLYKIHSVALSVTPSYEDESNAQQMVENEPFDTPGVITEQTVDGEQVQVEQCTEPRATCYILWHLGNDGNNTVLGQGCWRGSSDSRGSCDKCTRVTSKLPATRFCCCTQSYCNAHYLSLKEEPITPIAESTTAKRTDHLNVPNIISAAILSLIALGVMAVAFNRIVCQKRESKRAQAWDKEKGDLFCNPDAMATGLSCVDNLTLLEHIGRGKFGSVWRGTLGATPVAVKIYTSPSAWQKEKAIYEIPTLSHTNLLKYYGSSSRRSLTTPGGMEWILVVEACTTSLRAKLHTDTLSWRSLATLAHGLASATAHLHTQTETKPCIVHRDINSNNVLITATGEARLADLGLAQLRAPSADSRLTEAGTLRYLSPEALEGALDGGSNALLAVDVYAMALVLWEMLSRTRVSRHSTPPPYCLPYSELEPRASAHLQSVVCRDKVRPHLPTGPSDCDRALRLMRETIADCWDHDADARLTAVCVEERMNELKQILSTSGPIIHDNIHPHSMDANYNQPPDPDKNSNCLVQNCDVRTPLLYAHPHIGRNPCLERNTHTNETTHVELVHKSLKDISVQSVPNTDSHRQNEEPCLSVARVNHNRILTNENAGFNEMRSYQRPLDYIPNDVTLHDDIKTTKDTNLHQEYAIKVEKSKPWNFKHFFEKNLLRKESKPVETEVKLVHEHLNSNSNTNGKIKTTIVDKSTNVNQTRPSNLVLNENGRLYHMEGPCLSPPNRTLSPTMMIESELNRENRVFNFKEMPSKEDDKPPQIFAVIVPKQKPHLIDPQKRSNSESSNKSGKTCLSSIKSGGNSESEDSTFKKRLSADNKIICASSNSGRSSRASINLELQYLDSNNQISESPFEVNSDFSSSEDEHLMLLSENGSKITMQTLPKHETIDILKESRLPNDFSFNYQNKYANFDNEYSDATDKENLLNTYSGDNPVYLATVTTDICNPYLAPTETCDPYLANVKTEICNPYLAPTEICDPYLANVKTEICNPYLAQTEICNPYLANVTTEIYNPDTRITTESQDNKINVMKRQRSLEEVSELFSSSGQINLMNPAGRVKTPGDIPIAVRKARRDRAMQKRRPNESNRLSLYDDRMMFGNSL